jgi:hypothetical protein
MNNFNQFAPNPYIQQGQQQDLGGLSPVFQNIASQQANQNAAMQQGAALNQQAAELGQQSGNINPMLMAAALRKGKTPDQATTNAKDVQMGGLSTYNPITQFGIAQQYGTDPFSESSRMIAAQEKGFRNGN